MSSSTARHAPRRGRRREHRVSGRSAAYGLAVLRLSDQSQRAERAAVEGVGSWRRTSRGRWPGGASFTAPSMASVPELVQEGVGQGVAREPRDALDQLELRQGVEDVGRLHQAPGLLGDGLDERRVRVAQAADRPARHQVQVLAALGVGEPGAATLGHHHRVALHHRDEVLGLDLPGVLDLHGLLRLSGSRNSSAGGYALGRRSPPCPTPSCSRASRCPRRSA